MNWKNEWKVLLLMVVAFLGCFCLPVGSHRFTNAILESLRLIRWYAREHVLLCLVPAFSLGITSVAAFVAGVVGLSAVTSRRQDKTGEWFAQSWSFAKQILPPLLVDWERRGKVFSRAGTLKLHRSYLR